MHAAPPASILRLSRLMATVSLCLSALLFVGAAALWVHPASAEFMAREVSGLRDHAFTIDPLVQVLGAGLTLAHTGLVSAALLMAARLFRGFASGPMLVPETGRGLRWLGAAIALYGLTAPFVRTLMVLIATFGNPPGQRYLSVSLHSQDFVLAILGALILILGHVMAEAARIADEHAQIV